MAPSPRTIDLLTRLIGFDTTSHASNLALIRFVADRPGHDRRYSIDSSKVRAMGWAPAKPFEERLAETVAWYRDNRWWGERVRSGEFRESYERMYGKRLAEATEAPQALG